jgi:hypothetical protein
LNWAVYFCDFINAEPHYAGSSSASDINISYKRRTAVFDHLAGWLPQTLVHREFVVMDSKLGSEIKRYLPDA